MKFDKRIRHALVFWLLCGLRSFVIRVPLSVSRKLASGLATIGYYLVAKNRRKTVSNLRNIYSTQLTHKQLTTLAKATYQHWAKCIVELLSLLKLSKTELQQLVRVEGQANLDEAMQQNKGIVCLLAHYGNWELLGAYFSMIHNLTINVVGNELYDKRVELMLNDLRTKVGLHILPRGNAIKASLSALRQKQILAIMADYDGGGETINLPFLESSIRFPTAPLFFAYRSGATVLPAFIVRQPDDTHCVYIEKPLRRKLNPDVKLDFQNYIAQFVSLVESYIRREPTQWAWME